MTSGIYTITAPSGSKYVGMSASGISDRWKNHLKDLKNGLHKCKGLQRAYAKYGVENLKFEIVEVLDDETESVILLKEQLWWDNFEALGINLYNGRPSGKVLSFIKKKLELRYLSQLLINGKIGRE